MDSQQNSSGIVQDFKTSNGNGFVSELVAPELFSLKDVCLEISGTSILKGISVDINFSDFVFLIGPTGAGKSTLINLLASRLAKTSGQLVIADRIRNRKLFMAQVFQDLKLFSDFSIADNLLFSYDPQVYQSKKAFLELAMEYLELFQLHRRINEKVMNLNVGGKQIVAIIRCLLSRPDVILADEPTSSLDFETSKKVFDLLHYHNIKKNTTILWATHDIQLVKKFHGQVLKIEKGRLKKVDRACFI
jgi:cell division transport system ATP-binding protein